MAPPSPLPLVARAERDQIDRLVLAWANTYPGSPVGFVSNFLEPTAPAIAIQPIQSAGILRRYILGGYLAEYQFSVTYRIKPGNSPDKRLAALETLNGFGEWAETNFPDIGAGLTVTKIEASNAVPLAAYEDGDEDFQILMKMTYERVN